jgi:Co/Zn/Cd efflux system component
MALLADGLHMASHALALGIAAVAYLARRHAHDPRLSFIPARPARWPAERPALAVLPR